MGLLVRCRTPLGNHCLQFLPLLRTQLDPATPLVQLCSTTSGTRSLVSCVAKSGRPGASASADTRPEGWTATALDHARPAPMSMPTIGFPTRGGTGRASVRSQSSPDKSCTLSSGDGRFSLNDLNRAANRVSPGQSRYKLVDLAKHTSPRMGRAEGGVMRKGKGASIMDYFETLEDPRIDRCKRHQLLDIIAIAICAVICGADSWVYIELFGKSKPDLPGTAPRHPVPRHLRRRLLPAGPGAVPAVLHGLDPGSVRPGPRGSGGHRRQDGTAFPRPQFGPAGHPPGQRLGLGQHAVGQVGEVQRNHRSCCKCWNQG